MKFKLFLAVVLVLSLVGMASAVPPVMITNPDGSSPVGITNNRLNINSITTDKTVSTTTMVDAVTLDDNPTTYTSAALSTGGFDKVSFFWDYDETEHVGEIEAYHLHAGGSGYAVNDVLTVVEAGASGGTITVDSVYVGSITTINATPTVGGTGYSVDDVLTITTEGTGGTATVTEVTEGVVTAVSKTTAGTGYTAGAGKATTVAPEGGSGCTLNITAVDGVVGEIVTSTLTTGGLVYTVADEKVTSVEPAGGTGATVDVTAIGTALSATLTITGSVDNVTYLPLSFYDYGGGATLQTSEVLSADGSYMCWFNRDITIPYIKVTITGTNTDANDTELNTLKAYLQK